MDCPRALLVASLLLAGCSQPAGDEAPSLGGDSTKDATDAAGLPAGPFPAPVLKVGQSWTYRTAGYWDSTHDITVVVARADEQGYVLTGATAADLTDEVAWDRAYFGAVDLAMQPSDGGPGGWIQFPLVDGASWWIGEVLVMALAANVTAPNGTVPGFAIRGATEFTTLEIDYAPSLASVTRYARSRQGDTGPSETLELVATGTTTSWVTLQRGDEAYFAAAFADPTQPGSPVPVSLDVTADDEWVFVWTLAAAGTRVGGNTGSNGTWTFDGQGNRAFKVQTFPASAGPWTVAAVPGSADAWAYAQLHAARFIAGP